MKQKIQNIPLEERKTWSSENLLAWWASEKELESSIRNFEDWQYVHALIKKFIGKNALL